MALNKLVRTHPVEKILAAIPYSENYIRVTVVDGTQHLVGNEARHFVNEPGTFAKSLLESIGVFLFHVDAIGNSYHFDSYPTNLELPSTDYTDFADKRLAERLGAVVPLRFGAKALFCLELSLCNLRNLRMLLFI